MSRWYSVQLLSRVLLFATPWIAARQASLSITNSQSLLRPTSIESVMPSSHLILCRPLFLLPQIPPSIRVFSNESTLCMRWPKYWNFSFSIIPSKEHPGVISFRMDWLDLLSVQGTLEILWDEITTHILMWLKIKQTKIDNAGQEYRPNGNLAGGYAKWYSPFGKVCQFLIKLNNLLSASAVLLLDKWKLMFS